MNSNLNLALLAGSGAVALAHFDGSGVDEAVCTMVSRVQELALGYPEGRIELQLIGGYRDSQGYGEDVFYSIMRKLAPGKGSQGVYLSSAVSSCRIIPQASPRD